MYMCVLIWENSFVQGLSESPDFEFEYADTDKWAAELSGVCGHFVVISKSICRCT